ncbi:MAG: hypothetical protein ACNI27_00030 [Desulfovibrio sp.]
MEKQYSGVCVAAILIFAPLLGFTTVASVWWTIAFLFPNTLLVLSNMENKKNTNAVWLLVYFVMLMGLKMFTGWLAYNKFFQQDIVCVLCWMVTFFIWLKVAPSAGKRLSSYYIMTILINLIGFVIISFIVDDFVQTRGHIPLKAFILLLVPALPLCSLPFSLMRGSLFVTAIVSVLSGVIFLFMFPPYGGFLIAYGLFLVWQSHRVNKEDLPEDVPLSEATRIGGISNAHVPKGE